MPCVCVCWRAGGWEVECRRMCRGKNAAGQPQNKPLRPSSLSGQAQVNKGACADVSPWPGQPKKYRDIKHRSWDASSRIPSQATHVGHHRRSPHPASPPPITTPGKDRGCAVRVPGSCARLTCHSCRRNFMRCWLFSPQQRPPRQPLPHPHRSTQALPA